MSFIAAVEFLTSIPVPGKRSPGPEQLGRATAWFSLIGVLLGLILAGLNRVFLFFLPASVVNALLVVALVGLTGAIHLDGFGDTCDGIAGHKSVEERWKVMRDSRTGAFGVVGIVLVLLLKYVSLNEIPPETMTGVLIIVPAASRWAMVYALFAFRYARPSGLGTAYKKATRWPQFIIATVVALGAAGALFPWISFSGLLIVPGVFIIATLLAFYFRCKFAGLTGDTYGAINEVCEVAGLLFAIIIAIGTTWI